jgi:SNF2 family DNA or RNA helicase
MPYLPFKDAGIAHFPLQAAQDYFASRQQEVSDPMDIMRIQELLLKMPTICNLTYLIDRNTNISPKMNELEGVLNELIIKNGRKVVIFSEWTTMTYLVGKQLSKASIPLVELSGKVPVNKR